MNKDFIRITIIAIILMAIVAGGSIWATLYAVTPVTEPVEHLFVDLNGDGQLDLLVKGEVVYNASPLALK